MGLSLLRFIVPVIAISSILDAASPDIGNLNNCVNEVLQANATAPTVPTFDVYKNNYQKLLADLQAATPSLPYVYQQAAAKPLIQYLTRMGQFQYNRIFNGRPQDQTSQALQQMIPDVALAILFHNGVFAQSVNAFEEVVSDLYDGFISDAARVSRTSGVPINTPTFGTIPPLVKFGNADAGPYTWPCDSTTQLLGVRCPIVSLPPAQIKGGLLAWSSLGHETAGHDCLHSTSGLLQELSQKVRSAVLTNYNNNGLANYWATCIDETASDVLGYLNMGPAAGIGLIGYFRSFGGGKLRNIGVLNEPHPIDILRGYLAAAVVKRLNFKAAKVWSTSLASETAKDSPNTLYLVDEKGNYYQFPAAYSVAIASTEIVADTIMNTKLTSLQGHSLAELQSWNDNDQAILKALVTSIETTGQLPINLQGPGFYADHVVSASIIAGLKSNANIGKVFGDMLSYLEIMHTQNPTWSKTATPQALLLLESVGIAPEGDKEEFAPRSAVPNIPEEFLTSDQNVAA